MVTDTSYQERPSVDFGAGWCMLVAIGSSLLNVDGLEIDAE